jgi:predicted nucleic acid-binding protein
LLDTNILSEVLRKSPNAKLIGRLAQTSRTAQFTSCICVVELRYGSRRRKDHELFWERIRSQILPEVTILGLTDREAIIAGDLLALLERRGEPLPLPDALIAATALEAGLTVVTANIRHFQRIPHLKIENWLV